MLHISLAFIFVDIREENSLDTCVKVAFLAVKFWTCLSDVNSKRTICSLFCSSSHYRYKICNRVWHDFSLYFAEYCLHWKMLGKWKFRWLPYFVDNWILHKESFQTSDKIHFVSHVKRCRWSIHYKMKTHLTYFAADTKFVPKHPVVSEMTRIWHLSFSRLCVIKALPSGILCRAIWNLRPRSSAESGKNWLRVALFSSPLLVPSGLCYRPPLPYIHTSNSSFRARLMLLPWRWK